MPGPRGGMGVAALVGTKIYCIGGETSPTSTNPQGIFSRVDIYDTTTNVWTSGPSLPRGRHGFYPVTDGSYIYVAAGGIVNGYSVSSDFTRLAVTGGATSPTTATTMSTTPGTTTTVPLCPNSGLNGIMACRDGTTCNVNTNSLGWACFED